MAKTNMIERERKRKKMVAKYAKKREELKKQSVNMKLSPEVRNAAMEQLQKLPRDASPIRVQRRCRLTGRPHAVYRKFGLCRNKLREVAMRGEVPGLRKASW
jgi:small subunit ribosomal protein S14